MMQRMILGVLGSLACAIAGANAQTTNFPASGTPIQLVVPYAAGGTTDTAARLMAAGLEKELRTSVQVVNKPGAASQTALSQLVKARPNGYMLAYAVLPTVVTHYLDPERDAPYTRKNFQPIALHFHVPMVLAVQINNPAKTLKDLVDAAKAKPETITISDSGVMGTPHMAVLMLEYAAGVRFASVHFDGGVPSITALLGGHVQVLAGGIPDATPNVKAGNFRALGIADDKTSDLLPGVPTMQSQGFDVMVASSTGIIGPAGMPKDVVATLERAVKAVLDSDEGKKKTIDLGVTPRYMDSQAYNAYWAEQENRIGPILKAVRAKK